MLLLAHMELLATGIELVTLILGVSKSNGIKTSANRTGILSMRRKCNLINTLLIQDWLRARRDVLLLNAKSTWVHALLHTFMNGRSGNLLGMSHLLHLWHINRLVMLVMVHVCVLTLLLLLLLLLSFSFATVVVFFIGCATIVLHSFFSGILLSNANLLFPPLPFRGLLLLLSPPLNITDPNVRIPSLSEDDDDVVVPVPVGGTSNRIPTCK